MIRPENPRGSRTRVQRIRWGPLGPRPRGPMDKWVKMPAPKQWSDLRGFPASSSKRIGTMQADFSPDCRLRSAASLGQRDPFWSGRLASHERISFSSRSAL